MTTEKRAVPDRRRLPTKPFSRHSLKGRRMISRRQGEEVNYYVDRYETKYFAIVCAVLLLCVIDAYLTLRILRFGGNELNPLMLIFIDRRPALAMIAKYLGTAACIVIILVHKNFVVFGGLKVRYFLYVVFIIYCGLVLYEAYIVLTRARVFGPLA
jgi:hypothetical protein